MADQFQKYYQQLNAEQRDAVDSIDGPVMVVAGPGTGKTQILTLRIANILQKTDTPAEAVLALTFTEAGVAAMRRRLSEVIGSQAYKVAISTFHSFCNDIIRNYPEEFPHIIGAKSITEVDQITLMQNVIDKAKIKDLRPFGDRFYYLKPAMSAINKLKQEGIEPEKFKAIIAKEEASFATIDDLYYESGAHKGKMKGKYQDQLKHINKNKELAVLYADYQNQLKASRLYDYNDMIIEVVSALNKNQDLLLTLQEKHQYLLVDEHQDTNNAQNRILELLANFHDNPNLFVVGDEKQAIFRFQGASLENFLYFQKLYKKAKLINLEQNYRSTQTILDTAFNFAKRGVQLKANQKHPENKVQLFEFSQPEVESFALAKSIEQKLKDNVRAEEIAVLYRDNRDALPIAAMLEKTGVPFVLESDQNVLGDPDIKKLLLILHAVKNYGDPGMLLQALHVDFLNIPPLEVYKLARLASQERKNPYELMATNAVFKDCAAKLAHWKTLSQNNGAAESFESIVRESGLLASILSKPDAVEKIEKVRALFDQIKALVENHRDYSLDQFLNHLDILQQNEVMLKARAPVSATGRVRLMTTHRSKGLEFEYVYIVNAFDGHWGNRRRIEYFKFPPAVFALSANPPAVGDSEDDERNLFYVALTRAKKGVTISYAREGINKREQLPSQFLQELDAKLIEAGEPSANEQQFAKNREILFAPSKSTGPELKDKQFIKELFQHYGLSVTALNNYLECPWKYFYVNLVRIPEAPNKHLAFGNAVHGALRSYFDAWALGENKASAFLIARFKELLARQPITQSEYEEALEKGELALTGYHKKYYGTWPRTILNEYKIDGVQLNSDIRLNGTVDRLDIQGLSNQVTVVDYKTGKPKSRNQIDGSTASSDGNYKRQLVFYNLLLNKFQDGKYKMIAGDIDFVEPDPKGNYKRESFIINPEEVKELEETILTVSDEILNLKFWNKTCGEKDCRYCDLHSMTI